MGQYKLNQINDSTGVANITLNPSGIPTFGGGLAAFTYASGTLNETIGNTVSPIRFYTPTVDTDFVQLNTTWTTSQMVKIANLSATKTLTVRASGGAGEVIATLYPKSSCEIIPNTATPSTKANWESLNPLVSDWFDQSAAWTTTGITPVTKSFFVKRSGDSLQARIVFDVATVPVTEASLVIPSGLTIDTTKILADSTSPFFTHSIGIVGRFPAAATYFTAANVFYVFVDSSLNTKLFFNYVTAAAGMTKAASWFALYAAGEMTQFNFEIPITGWTSTKG